MADRNDLCGQESCDQPAYMFGLVGGGMKRTVCREHLSTLTDKGVSVFEMAAYQFIESPDDYPLYLRRKAQMERGLENITALESRCETDLNSMQGHIEATKASVLTAVEKVFQELHMQSTQYCDVLKQKLHERRLLVEQLTKDKLFEMNPEEASLIESGLIGPFFQLTLEDCAESIASLLRAHHYFHITESGSLIEPKLPELLRLKAVLAKSNKEEWSKVHWKQRWKAAKQILRLFPTMITQEYVKEVVLGYVKGTVLARHTGTYAKALKKLERGQALLQQHNLFDPLLYLHMSDVRAYYGEWTLAEEVLRQGMDFHLQTEPTSIMTLQFSNRLIELNHQRQLYEKTVELGEWTLNTWGNTQHSFELLRTLFFLMDACCYVDEKIKGFKLMDVYAGKIEVKDRPSNCLLLFTQASRSYREEKYRVAVELFYSGMKLSEQLPTSTYLIVYVKDLMGKCYKELNQYDRTKVTLTQTLHLYIAHFPQSPQTFSFIHSIAHFYCFPVKKLEEGQAVLKKLIEFFLSQFPQSLGPSFCIQTLGSLYRFMKRYEEADEQYQQALTILSVHFPHSIQYADCLHEYGNYLESRKQREQAKEQYLKAFQLYLSFLTPPYRLTSCLESLAEIAHTDEVEDLYLQVYQIYSDRLPQSLHFAEFLRAFGDFYKCQELYEKSEERYVAAYTICSQYFPQSREMINCIEKLGDLYKDMQRNEEAAEQYLTSCQLYTSYFPHSRGYTYHLQHFAEFYEEMGKSEAAIEYYVKACEVYEARSSSDSSFVCCLAELGKLYESKGLKREAIQRLKQAAKVLKYGGSLMAEKCKQAILRLSR